MKTRFSPLVKLKKSTMQKSEQVVQKANANLNNASMALEQAYLQLKDVEPPQSGTISEMLASRALLNSQRGVINNSKEWVNYASNQVDIAKDRLKQDMIDFEKFNYLELEEVKKEIKKRKLQEAKDLDEVALMTYERKT